VFHEFQPIGGVEARDFDVGILKFLSMIMYIPSIEPFSLEINNSLDVVFKPLNYYFVIIFMIAWRVGYLIE
jgi:hypothetical protein